jgi:hypothetical protein
MYGIPVTEWVTTYDDGLWICPCGERTDGMGDTPFVRVIPGTIEQHPDDAPCGEHMCQYCGRVADMDDEAMPIVDRRDPARFVVLPEQPRR